jgi:hypothetical protein
VIQESARTAADEEFQRNHLKRDFKRAISESARTAADERARQLEKDVKIARQLTCVLGESKGTTAKEKSSGLLKQLPGVCVSAS